MCCRWQHSHCYPFYHILFAVVEQTIIKAVSHWGHWCLHVSVGEPGIQRQQVTVQRRGESKRLTSEALHCKPLRLLILCAKFMVVIDAIIENVNPSLSGLELINSRSVEDQLISVSVKATIISAVRNSRPLSVSSSFAYATPLVSLSLSPPADFFLHTDVKSAKLCLHPGISFSSLLPGTFVFWQGERKKKQQKEPQTQPWRTFFCTCWILDSQGGSLHNVWMWRVPSKRRWRGGRRAVCSASLDCVKLVGWVTSGEGGGRAVGGWRSWGEEPALGSFPLTCSEQRQILTLDVICCICKTEAACKPRQRKSSGCTSV